MNSVRHMMMHLAVLIVLLHSFVPHHHHQETTAAADCISIDQDQHPNLVDLLGDLFHTDLGADHLENLQTSSGLQVSLELSQELQAIPPFISKLSVADFQVIYFIDTLFELSDNPITGFSIPRAPPHRVQLS